MGKRGGKYFNANASRLHVGREGGEPGGTCNKQTVSTDNKKGGKIGRVITPGTSAKRVRGSGCTPLDAIKKKNSLQGHKRNEGQRVGVGTWTHETKERFLSKAAFTQRELSKKEPQLTNRHQKREAIEEGVKEKLPSEHSIPRNNPIPFLAKTVPSRAWVHGVAHGGKGGRKG